MYYNIAMKILLVEDDSSVASMVKNGLCAEAHTVEIAADGMDGSFLGRSYDYDTIVLDYSLPKKDGLKVCEEIRAAGRTAPIIFLSATDDIPVKVAAFKCGADDYVTKPFSMAELNARVRAVTRRPARVDQPILRVDDITLDTNKQTVCRGKNKISLTHKEFNMLEYFMRNTGVILSRALIMEHVWTADCDPLSNTIESHIRNLRKKINARNKPNLIANVPGRGYVIDTAENLEKIL